MANKFLKDESGKIHINSKTGGPITVYVPDANEVSGVSPTYWVQDRRNVFSLMIMPFKVTNQNIVGSAAKTENGLEVMLKYE